MDRRGGKEGIPTTSVGTWTGVLPWYGSDGGVERSGEDGDGRNIRTV